MNLLVFEDTIPFIPHVSISMTTGITTWLDRGYCNFAVRIVQDPNQPSPSDFSSKILSKVLYVEYPPNNMTPFPSGDDAIAPQQILYGNSGPVDNFFGILFFVMIFCIVF